MCPASLSYQAPFPARLFLVSTYPLPAPWTLPTPSMPFCSWLLPCPHFPWPAQSICADGQCPPLALVTPCSSLSASVSFIPPSAAFVLSLVPSCTATAWRLLVPLFPPGSPRGHPSPLLWNPVTPWSRPIALSFSVKCPFAFVERPCIPVRGV